VVTLGKIQSVPPEALLRKAFWINFKNKTPVTIWGREIENNSSNNAVKAVSLVRN
jgi:hypothetical protein